MTNDVQVIGDTRQQLGESPLWCANSSRLYWVDINASCIHALEFAGVTATNASRWDLPARPSALALRETGGLVVATQAGIGYFDPADGSYAPVAAIETGRGNNRSNEGKCDPRGRFWVGTMDDREQANTGALYRIDTDMSVTRVLDGIGIPNTLIWPADGRQMLFADTVQGEIYRFDFDADSGVPGNRRRFARVPEGTGAPDGSTLDSDGYLWTAIFGGGRLIRWTPDGAIDREIALPVRQPTSCIFGGPGLETLFVTTASKGLDDDTLEREPDNGKLLAIHSPAGATGMPEPRFCG